MHFTQGLDELLSVVDSGLESAAPARANPGLTKCVLARRTELRLDAPLDALGTLTALQQRDPRAYQIFLGLPAAQDEVPLTPINRASLHHRR